MGMLGGYHSLLLQSRTRIVVSSFVAPMIGVSVVALVLYALKNPEWSRLLIFSFASLSAIGLCSTRILLRRYFFFRRNSGYYAKNVILIGLPACIKWMVDYFAQNVSTSDYRLLGYLGISSDQTEAIPYVSALTRGKKDATTLASMGTVDKLGDLLIRRPIDEVIVTQPSGDSRWVKQVILDCDYLGVLLRIVPEVLLIDEPRVLTTLYPHEALRLPAVVLAPPHLDSDALFVKRLIDIVVSASLLVLLAPLFAIVALAIKLTTPNLPVFYPWHVVGQQGKRFTGYKFSTMCADADKRKSELMVRNEMTGPVFKIKDDPRTTPLGRLLRKYSINELPQLWSVLKADMSLVGPRPAFPHELARYDFWHKRKLSIRPGITCLWQIRGRNKVSDFDEWVRMDMEYVDNWSLWLDFKILVWTAWVVLKGTGS